MSDKVYKDLIEDLKALLERVPKDPDDWRSIYAYAMIRATARQLGWMGMDWRLRYIDPDSCEDHVHQKSQLVRTDRSRDLVRSAVDRLNKQYEETRKELLEGVEPGRFVVWPDWLQLNAMIAQVPVLHLRTVVTEACPRCYPDGDFAGTFEAAPLWLEDDEPEFELCEQCQWDLEDEEAYSEDQS